ncbi:unnamed protein product [Prorocentrum cordatum]|uniref:Uncharacterized protein n=1 Tax=Prorocentrum cordatum TaxID=2364126 RepID=A0ABN9RYA6_9DINO|nr:unnamed protein product [Polarella glacialis]
MLKYDESSVRSCYDSFSGMRDTLVYCYQHPPSTFPQYKELEEKIVTGFNENRTPKLQTHQTSKGDDPCNLYWNARVHLWALKPESLRRNASVTFSMLPLPDKGMLLDQLHASVGTDNVREACEKLSYSGKWEEIPMRLCLGTGKQYQAVDEGPADDEPDGAPMAPRAARGGHAAKVAVAWSNYYETCYMRRCRSCGED